jgi:hypothetical protein
LSEAELQCLGQLPRSRLRIRAPVADEHLQGCSVL